MVTTGHLCACGLPETRRCRLWTESPLGERREGRHVGLELPQLGQPWLCSISSWPSGQVTKSLGTSAFRTCDTGLRCRSNSAPQSVAKSMDLSISSYLEVNRHVLSSQQVSKRPLVPSTCKNSLTFRASSCRRRRKAPGLGEAQRSKAPSGDPSRICHSAKTPGAPRPLRRRPAWVCRSPHFRTCPAGTGGTKETQSPLMTVVRKRPCCGRPRESASRRGVPPPSKM